MKSLLKKSLIVMMLTAFLSPTFAQQGTAAEKTKAHETVKKEVKKHKKTNAKKHHYKHHKKHVKKQMKKENKKAETTK
jgi:Ni/Co efflux regulator RcnB